MSALQSQLPVQTGCSSCLDDQVRLGAVARLPWMAVHLVRCVHRFSPGAPRGYPKEAPAVAGGRGSYPGQTGALAVQHLGQHDRYEDLSASHRAEKMPDNWRNDDHQLGKALGEPGGLQVLMETVPLEVPRDVSAQVDHVSTRRDPGAVGDLAASGHQTVYGTDQVVAVDLLAYPANRPP